jgi:hypothetical protein
MGLSVRVHWPEATEEEEQGHPGFFNGEHAWVSWIILVRENASAIRRLERLGFEALLSHVTAGADADAIDWTTPDALERAATDLRKLVQVGDPTVEALVEIYEANAPGEDKASIEFARDLGDIADVADYARGLGASTVTLGYYW